MSILNLDDEQIYEDRDFVNEDIPQLRDAWVNEVSCPELCPYQMYIVHDLLEQIENQVEISIS